MKRLARWLGWSALTLALLYGFAVLGGALWLRRVLTSENLATTRGCWDKRASIRMARSQRHRDGMVLYALNQSAAAPERRGPGSNPYMVLPSYVYLTWWPLAERQRLYVEASRIVQQHPCRPWTPDSLDR